MKHVAIKGNCGVGKRGQTAKNATGLENEVGTPRQFRYITNQVRGAAACIYIYIHIDMFDEYTYTSIIIYLYIYIYLHISMYECIYLNTNT